MDVKGELTALGAGEAFVSVLDDAGVPTRVERVSIVPPSGQVAPISELERRAIIEGVHNGNTLRQRYGAELRETEAIHSFYNRMRRVRGIAEEAFKGGWQEGDYRQFMPNICGARPAVRSATWRGLAGWSVVAASCVFVIGAVLS